MLAFSYRAKERVEAAIELAFEITGRSDSLRRSIGAQLLEGFLKLGEVHLDYTQRALAIEDTDEQKFLRSGRRARHEDLTLCAGVMHLVERFPVELTSELTGRRVDCRRERANRHHVGGVGEAELTNSAPGRIEQHTRNQPGVLHQLAQWRGNPGFCYRRIAHAASPSPALAAVIMSSLTRPRFASGVTIVTSTTSRAPTTQMCPCSASSLMNAGTPSRAASEARVTLEYR